MIGVWGACDLAAVPSESNSVGGYDGGSDSSSMGEDVWYLNVTASAGNV